MKTKLSCILALIGPLAEEKAKDPALRDVPAVPRIESVVSNEIQAHQHDSSVIWHQNFNVGL